MTARYRRAALPGSRGSRKAASRANDSRIQGQDGNYGWYQGYTGPIVIRLTK